MGAHRPTRIMLPAHCHWTSLVTATQINKLIFWRVTKEKKRLPIPLKLLFYTV